MIKVHQLIEPDQYLIRVQNSAWLAGARLITFGTLYKTTQQLVGITHHLTIYMFA